MYILIWLERRKSDDSFDIRYPVSFPSHHALASVVSIPSFCYILSLFLPLGIQNGDTNTRLDPAICSIAKPVALVPQFPSGVDICSVFIVPLLQ